MKIRKSNYSSLCRLCLINTSMKLDIFCEEGLQRELREKILNCLSLVVSEEDNLPKFVCHTCITKLDSFQEFRNASHNSEIELNAFVSTSEDILSPENECQEPPWPPDPVRFNKKRSPRPKNSDLVLVPCRVKLETLDDATACGSGTKEPVQRTWGVSNGSETLAPDSVGSNFKNAANSFDFSSCTKKLTDTKAEVIASESASFSGSVDEHCDNAMDEDDDDDDIQILETECKKEVEDPCETNSEMSSAAAAERLATIEGNSKHKLPKLTSSLNVHQRMCSRRLTQGNLRRNDTNSDASHHQEPLFSAVGSCNFVCNICTKSFSEKWLVVRHLRTHTGEKPYKCRLCSNAFRQASHLKAHLRTHTGEKPYWCPICNRGFSSKCTVERHMVVHGQPSECSDVLKLT